MSPSIRFFNATAISEYPFFVLVFILALTNLTRTVYLGPPHYQDSDDNQCGGDAVSECHNFYPFQYDARKKKTDDRLRIPDGCDLAVGTLCHFNSILSRLPKLTNS